MGVPDRDFYVIMSAIYVVCGGCWLRMFDNRLLGSVGTFFVGIGLVVLFGGLARAIALARRGS